MLIRKYCRIITKYQINNIAIYLKINTNIKRIQFKQNYTFKKYIISETTFYKFQSV
jgi:hypothetical protein